MQETPFQLHPGAEQEGLPCTHCRAALAAGEEAVVCPRCKALHHVACWREKGGCARYGCPQVAKLLVPRQPRRDPPPPGPDRRLVLLGVLGALLLLGALTFSVIQQTAAEEPALTVMTVADPGEEAFLQEGVEAFLAGEDGLQVDLQPVPYIGYEQKLVVLMAVQDAPDVFSLSQERWPIYAENGALLALDDPAWEVEAFLEEHLPADRLREGILNGVRYGVPHPSRPELLVISVQSEHPPAAWRLLRHLLQVLPVEEAAEPRPEGAPTPAPIPFPGL